MDEELDEEDLHLPKRRRIGSVDGRPLRILLIILLVFVFAGGIYYFLSRPAGEDTSALQTKVGALEQKIMGLEKQLSELQGKVGASAPDAVLLQRIDALAGKVEALERERQARAESKAKPSDVAKPAAPTGKQYHIVQKGETLYGISKKYGISVDALQKLNNLSPERPLRVGQKLVVSSKP